MLTFMEVDAVPIRNVRPPTSKGVDGMARATAARALNAAPRAPVTTQTPRINSTGRPTLGKGQGIPAYRGRTSGPTWTKKGLK